MIVVWDAAGRHRRRQQHHARHRTGADAGDSVRRAIGARPWSIISQILSESFLLTFIAGILGLAAGVGALSVFEKLIAATTELGSDMQPLQISFGLGITATLIIIAGSLLAGIIPASRCHEDKGGGCD